MNYNDYRNLLKGKYGIVKYDMLRRYETVFDAKDVLLSSRFVSNSTNDRTAALLELLLLGNDEEYSCAAYALLPSITKPKDIGIRTEYKVSSMLDILSRVYEFVMKEKDSENKTNKLAVLNEYIRLSRYLPDGKIRVNGYFNDMNKMVLYDINSRFHKNSVGKDGVSFNDFIDAASKVSFTEEEKGYIYAETHAKEKINK